MKRRSHMATSPPAEKDVLAASSPLVERPRAVEKKHRSGRQCPGSEEKPPFAATVQVAPTPPSSRSITHGITCNPRIASEERPGATAVRTALTANRTLHNTDLVAVQNITPPSGAVPQEDMNGSLGAGSKQRYHVVTTAVDALNSPSITPSSPLPASSAAGESSPLGSPGGSTTLLSRLRNHLAHAHGLSSRPAVTSMGTDTRCGVGQQYSRTSTASNAAGRSGGTKRGVDRDLSSTAPRPRLPQLQPVPAAQPASAERIAATSGTVTTSTPDTPLITQTVSHSQSNIDLTVAASSGVLKQAERISVEGCSRVDDSPNPTSIEVPQVSSPGLANDLVPEVEVACHEFLHHLPGVWARPIIRAVTLQTATLHVPQRLLRAPVLFDAYAELKAEVVATLEAVAGRTAANKSLQTKPGHPAFAGPLFHCVDMQRLLTVAPAILRYRLQNTCRIKGDEVRTGFRSNAQTASRTEASINRYAYLPHVQRDVHFGATLAQCVIRKMALGPPLLRSGSSRSACPPASAGDGGLRDAGQQHPLTAVTAPNNAQRDQKNLSLYPLAITYSAVSFEGFPSIFLKDRYDVAHPENVASGLNSAAQGSTADNPRHGGRRRRYIKPFFEREFSATLASGQEDAAFFATTLAPEFMVSLPSFLKHPERAVPLSIAASLHHLYTALSVEIFMHTFDGLFMQATDATASDKHASTAPAKATCGRAPSTSLSPLLPPVSPACERGGTPVSAAATPNIHPSGTPTPLRGPALELGMAYVRNTVLCSASTPGIESYLMFLHQIVYTERHGGNRRASVRGDAESISPPPPCRAVVQLSEEANGSMLPPAMPATVMARDGSSPPGTFSLPTVKHAAVELTQLLTWVQDERSHDPQHGQPFLCHLTFVPTYIANISTPTPTSLCHPLPDIELEDSNAFPCAVVLATLDMWKSLSPSVVSNLLRVCFVLDRHAQRVMELESPDYPTKEMPKSATAAEAGTTNNDPVNTYGANGAVTSAIPFPDPQLRQHVATTIAGQVRAYLEELPALDQEDGSHPTRLQQRQQRLLGFFMARLHYYETLNEQHCKTEMTLQHELLLRTADKRASPPTPSPMLPPNHDVYRVKTKPICDALAAVLAVEATVNTHNNSVCLAEFGDGVAAAQSSCWLPAALQQVYTSVTDTAETSNCADDTAAPETTASVVVLLVPLRDVQRR